MRSLIIDGMDQTKLRLPFSTPYALIMDGMDQTKPLLPSLRAVRGNHSNVYLRVCVCVCFTHCSALRGTVI